MVASRPPARRLTAHRAGCALALGAPVVARAVVPAFAEHEPAAVLERVLTVQPDNPLMQVLPHRPLLYCGGEDARLSPDHVTCVVSSLGANFQ